MTAAFRPRWIDHGETLEACPQNCGANLRWRDRWKNEDKTYIRVLECPTEGCPQPAQEFGKRLKDPSSWAVETDARTYD